MRKCLYYERFDAYGIRDDGGVAFQGDPVQVAYDLVYQSGERNVAMAGLTREVTDIQSLLAALPVAQHKVRRVQKLPY